MRSNIIVDDHLLISVLANETPEQIRDAAERGELFTTGSYYYRLARAALNPESEGTISRRLEKLSLPHQMAVFDAVNELPDGIGLMSLRHLVPVMSELDASGFHMNLLAAEAVAAALLAHAQIAVSTHTPLIAKTCEVLDIDYEVISL